VFDWGLQARAEAREEAKSVAIKQRRERKRPLPAKAAV
jgi:hypothetical protein